MIKAEITAKKECTVAVEGGTENILEELLLVIHLMLASVFERLNFPEEVNKEIVRRMIDTLEARFLG